MFLPAAIALLLAAPAQGAPPSLAELAAQADAVIAAAEAQAQFTNDTRRGLPAARHNESGLRCMFEVAAEGNRIMPVGSAAGRQGMACLSRPAGFSQSMEAIRLAPGETLDSVFAASVLAFQPPQARPHAPGGVVVRLAPGIGGKAAPEPRTAGYLVPRDGGEVYSRVSVAVVGDWIIRQRFDAPAARAEEAELLAGVVMSTTLIDLAARAG